MSGSTTGRAPRSDAELARDLHQRVKTLENPSTVRVGSWVLAERDGQLIASKPGHQFTLGETVEQVTTLIRQLAGPATATPAGGGDLLNIANFLDAFTDSTGIDLLGILEGLGGDVGAEIATISEFLTGWLSGIGVTPTLVTPTPLVQWFNTQLPPNTFQWGWERIVAYVMDFMDAAGLTVSDVLAMIGWGQGGVKGGALGLLGDVGAAAGLDDPWLLPIPKWLCDLITALTGGTVTFTNNPEIDWIHITFLGGDNPTDNWSTQLTGLFGNPTGAGTGSFASQAVSAATAVMASGAASKPANSAASFMSGAAGLISASISDDPWLLPIPKVICDFITMITGGTVTFTNDPETDWIHITFLGGDDPTNNWSTQLTGLFGNPTGNTGGSLSARAASAASVAAAPAAAISSSGVMQFAATLLSGGLQDGLDELLASYGLCDTRISAVGSGMSAAVNTLGLLSNPTGASRGSLPTAAGNAIWEAINCYGFAGQGFNLANNWAGALDNPTGASDGGLIGRINLAFQNYLSGRSSDALYEVVVGIIQLAGDPQQGTALWYANDLVKALFANGGRGVQTLTQFISEMANGDWLGLIGDLLFGGAWTLLDRISTDVLGLFDNPTGYDGGSVFGQLLAAFGLDFGQSGGFIFTVLSALANGDVGAALNFFGSPLSPSGANSDSMAAATAKGAASIVGLGDTTDTSPGLIGAASSWLNDLSRYFGNPTGLGSGAVTATAGLDSPVLDPVTALVDEFLAGFTDYLGGPPATTNTSHNLTNAVNAMQGVTTSTTAVDQHQLAVLHPGTTNNLIPDPNLTTDSVAGQGLWLYDGPPVSPTAIRTRRAGLVTVFWVMGTQFVGSALGDLALTDPRALIDFISTTNEDLHIYRPLDLTYFEVVNVPYPAALLDMNASVIQGTATLINMINAAPGPFVLVGGSQGGGVISNVYDEIRSGSLRHRDADFLLGVAMVNTRRELGSSFPGCPTFCPRGRGLIEPNLTGTVGDPRWWEWSPGVGTYPTPDGDITISVNDVVSCLDDSEVSYWVREIAGVLGAQPANVDTPTLMDLLQVPFHLMDIIEAAAELYNGLLGTATAAHGDTYFLIQPMIASGADPADERTYWQIVLDHLNVLGPTVVDPLEAGDLYELESLPFAALPEQEVTAGASVQWANVSAAGPAIMVAVNAYDRDGAFLGTVESDDTTVTDPAATMDWEPLFSHFTTPADTTDVTLVLRVMPEAVRTGVVWFKDPDLEMANRLDAALLDVSNIPQVGNDKVSGSQGIVDLGATLSHQIDGFTSAFGESSIVGATFSQMFAFAQDVSTKATQALALATSLKQRIDPLFNLPVSTKRDVAGDYLIDIIDWARVDGVLFDLIVLGGGGGGQQGRWFDTNPGGRAGTWNGRRCVMGVDIPSGTTQLKFHVGAGGIGNDIFGAGTHGGASTISLMDNTVLVSGAYGGLGGYQDEVGQGSGNYVLPESPLICYFGGADVGNREPGSSPGGGGAGYVFGGANGADGLCAVRISQDVPW